MIPYFSAHCITDHCISNPNPNPNHTPNHNPNPNHSPDHDCSHLLVRDAVGRNAVGRKGVTISNSSSFSRLNQKDTRINTGKAFGSPFINTFSNKIVFVIIWKFI